MILTKKIFLITCLTVILFTSFNSTSYAANIFGIAEKSGCTQKDPFLPTLAICGRNPASGACEAYTKPCTVGDLVETGERFLIFGISLLLLLVPIFIMYYGFQIIWNRDVTGNLFKIADIKKKLINMILYFILLLAAWLIVRTVVDIFQVREDINTFLIDENGNPVKARQFNTN